MINVLAQFFGILGGSLTPPGTFSEFLPWFLQVLFGIFVCVMIFRFVFSTVRNLGGGRWLS